MSTKKTSDNKTASEELTLEQRVSRLEKRAREHGWNLDVGEDPGDTEPGE